jgi:hypothetical protein
MPSTTNVLLIFSAIVALIAVALGAAYTTGALNPVIEKIGVYFFKAKAKAEEKKMEAQGMKEGEDFLKSMFYAVFLALSGWMCADGFYFLGDLKGNQQASDVKEGLGNFGGLKKSL